MTSLAHRNILLFIVTAFTLQSAPGLAQNLQLNGIAIHSELRQDFYIGALYLAVPNGSPEALHDSEQHKRMQLRVLNPRWSRRSFEQHWTQSILINNDEEDLASFAETILAFTSAVQGKLVSGDEIIIDHPPLRPVTLSVNGVTLMEVKERPRQFFRLLLNTWIGARPPSSSFKRDILNAPEDADDLLTVFHSLVPSSGRAEEIAAWAGTVPQATATASTSTDSASPADTADDANPEAEAEAEAQAQAAAAAAARAAAAAEAAAKKKAEEEAAAEAERIAEEQRIAREIAEQKAGLKLLYRSNVMKLIYSRVIYPGRAIDRNQEGTVELTVKLDKEGKLLDASYKQESEFALLNKAALRAVRAAEPFPAAPIKLDEKEIELLIPIRFQIPK